MRRQSALIGTVLFSALAFAASCAPSGGTPDPPPKTAAPTDDPSRDRIFATLPQSRLDLAPAETVLARPPELEVVRRRVKGVVHLTAPTDRCLPCRSELSYRYGNLEFLIVHRDTRRFLRGSGLLVHLIRDHRFFEGEESPLRLDPERAAHVLGLSS